MNGLVVVCTTVGGACVGGGLGTVGAMLWGSMDLGDMGGIGYILGGVVGGALIGAYAGAQLVA